MYGYVGLPDMLWLSDARDIIECHADLAQLFKKASKSRGAKRANDSFLIIATDNRRGGGAGARLRRLGQAFSGRETRSRQARRRGFRCVDALG